MRLTTKGRYGVRAMANLAVNSHNKPLSISQIAKDEDLSPEFLEQIFFKLKKADVIRSIRGPKGGFILNHKPADISIRLILDAVEEPLFPAPCTDCAEAPGCQRAEHCPIHPLWHGLYELIDKYLTNISLKDLSKKSARNDFSELKSGHNFTI